MQKSLTACLTLLDHAKLLIRRRARQTHCFGEILILHICNHRQNYCIIAPAIFNIATTNKTRTWTPWSGSVTAGEITVDRLCAIPQLQVDTQNLLFRNKEQLDDSELPCLLTCAAWSSMISMNPFSSCQRWTDILLMQPCFTLSPCAILLCFLLTDSSLPSSTCEYTFTLECLGSWVSEWYSCQWSNADTHS